MTSEAEADMPLWVCKVEFRTTHQILDETAQWFWGEGKDFHRTGAKRYEWVSEVSANGVQGVMAFTVLRVSKALKFEGQSEEPEIVRIDIRREEAEECSPTKSS